MAEKFFISDTHFGHDKILDFEAKARPFDGIAEHDEALIENWNSVVGKRDVVTHLGDVAFKPAATLHRVMPRLNGIKKLVLGNHDTSALENYTQYFTKVYSSYVIKDLGMIFTHIPVHPSQLEQRFKYNVHGHLHSNIISDPRYLNISCEHVGLTPISLDEIRNRLRHADRCRRYGGF